MADKSVGELIAAQSVTPTDLFVLEQNGTAKKLTGQILENWLVSFADGHGGIQSIVKKSTSGLVDTYRITLADTTTFDFMVTNGKGINSVSKVSTSGLVDTYQIAFNDRTSSTFTVTNGEKGDKGDNQYVWIKYASQKPTVTSHSFGDVADDWIGIYSGNASTAPTDWKQYKWYRIKGEQGDTGDPATIVSASITYLAGDSGTVIPSGSWSTSIPAVTPGRYLWTRQVLQFNTGNPITSYSVSRFGIDGTGAVSTVAGVAPDETGNVPLDASSVKALALSGGTMEGGINMNGQKITGLNAPTQSNEVATKDYVDNTKPNLTGYATELYVNNAVRAAATKNLLDNSDFTNPVNQRGLLEYEVPDDYTIDRWFAYHENGKIHVSIESGYVKLFSENTGNGAFSQRFFKGVLSEDKEYTFAYKTYDGNIVINNNPVVRFEEFDFVSISIKSNKTENIVWAALYEGLYTAETLPEYHTKGYAAELAECMRYYQKAGFIYPSESTNNTTTEGQKFYVPMRINPTLEIFDGTGNAGKCSIWDNSGIRHIDINACPSTAYGIEYLWLSETVTGLIGYGYEASADV